MKTARVIFAALILVTLLTACGGSAPAATQPPAPTKEIPTATEPPTAEPPTATEPPAPTPTPKILTITDATGAIEITVPSVWSEYNVDLVDNDPAQFASITASTSLDGFDALSAPGVYVGATGQDFMVADGYVGLLDAWKEAYSGMCSYTDRVEYADSKYVGQIDFFSGCNGNGDILLVLVAQPIDEPDYLVTVFLNETDLTKTDFLDSLSAILKSFKVVGELPK